MIDHESSVPVYVQLGDILREQIRNGTLTNRVPSVRTLSQEYGVSHMTVTKVLDILKSEDLIFSVKGKGSFVKPKAS
jgi:DNA-binding GntR family transcriptional regulator